MKTGFEDAIVLITSQNEGDQNFGTGFVIHRETGVSYILTCAHVVREVVNAMLHQLPATVIASDTEDGFDLAVLRVEAKLSAAPLKCGIAAEAGTFSSLGFYKSDHLRPSRKICGAFEKQGFLESKTFNCRAPALRLDIQDEQTILQEGNSGSPLFDEKSGQVIGIITTKENDGKKGLAVSLEALKQIWPEMPPGIFAQTQQICRSADLMNFDKELPAFERILRGEDTQTRLIRIHGQRGGEGKSTLLKEYELMAEQVEIPFMWVDFKNNQKPPRIEELLNDIVGKLGKKHFPQFRDCYYSGCAEPHNRIKEAEWWRKLTYAFFQGCAEGEHVARLVLLFDHYERCDREFRQWLADFFLPELPDTPLIVVIAGIEEVERPPSWEQQCHFPLEGMPIKCFFWYNEHKHANLTEEEIELYHFAFKGRPKQFVEIVEAAVIKRGVNL